MAFTRNPIDRTASAGVPATLASLAEQYFRTGNPVHVKNLYDEALRNEAFGAFLEICQHRHGCVTSLWDDFQRSYQRAPRTFNKMFQCASSSAPPNHFDLTTASLHSIRAVAALLWACPPSMRQEIAISFGAATYIEFARLVLCAGRDCISEVRFSCTGGVVVNTGKGMARMVVLLTNCAALRSVKLTGASQEAAEAMCRYLSDSHPFLDRLEIKFQVPPSDAHFTWTGADAPWTAPLPPTLRHLAFIYAFREFNSGLSETIARCCPSLLSLRLYLDDPHGSRWKYVDRGGCSARLAALVESLPLLRSLSLLSLCCDDDCVRAICAMPALANLELCGVEARTLDPVILAPGLPHLQRLICRSSFATEDGQILAALLRAASASPRLSSLEVSQFNVLGDTRWRTSVILPALRHCISTAPLEHLSLQAYAEGPIAREIIGAVLGAAQTLRSLMLKSLMFGSSQPGLTAVYRQLARCTRLEQLWWDVMSDPERQQGSLVKTPYRGALHDLISIVAAAAPRLTAIASPYQSSWSCKLAASAIQELHRRREREATGPAWAVVKVGLEQAQERRVRGAAGLLSPLFRLPPSVLRRLGEYLEATPLPLNIITDKPWCSSILHPFEDILGHSLFVGAA